MLGAVELEQVAAPQTALPKLGKKNVEFARALKKCGEAVKVLPELEVRLAKKFVMTSRRQRLPSLMRLGSSESREMLRGYSLSKAPYIL
eukprot:g19069.t1